MSVRKVSVPALYDGRGAFLDSSLVNISINSQVAGVVPKPTAPGIPGAASTVSMTDTLQVNDPQAGTYYLNMTREEYTATLRADSASGDVVSLVNHSDEVESTGAGSNELYSDVIVANQLANNGERLDFVYAGNFAATAATKAMNLFFADHSIYLAPALGIADTSWVVRGSIIRLSETEVKYFATISSTTGNSTPKAYANNLTGIDLSAENILAIAADVSVGGAAGDAVATVGTISWVSAAPES